MSPTSTCSHRPAEKTGRREARVSPLPTTEAEQGSSRRQLAVGSEWQAPEGASGRPRAGRTRAERRNAPDARARRRGARLPFGAAPRSRPLPGRAVLCPSLSFTKCLGTTPRVASQEPRPLDAAPSPTAQSWRRAWAVGAVAVPARVLQVMPSESWQEARTGPGAPAGGVGVSGLPALSPFNRVACAAQSQHPVLRR